MTIKKNYMTYQKEPPHTAIWKDWKVSEPDMAGILDLSYQEFKTMMILMLRALRDEVDSIQGQMATVIREMEILKRTKEKF